MFDLLTPLPTETEENRVTMISSNDITENQDLYEYEKGLLSALISDENDAQSGDIHEIIAATDVIQDKIQGFADFE